MHGKCFEKLNASSLNATLSRVDGCRWLAALLRDEANELVAPPHEAEGWDEMSFPHISPSPTCVLLSLLPSSTAPEGKWCRISVVPGRACVKSLYSEGT